MKNYKTMLLEENPKALQFLHHAHGFDFEKPVFIGGFPGRFTHKMVTDMIKANIGPDYIAAILVKPSNAHYWKKLHHVAVGPYKFNIENSKVAKWYNYNIDYFFGVGDFEETRKHKTERVYIIAQHPDYAVQPKNNIPIVSGIRYKMVDFRTAYDGRRNHYVNEITLQQPDGGRETVKFEPWHTFYGNEKRSDNINDYIDKSGYILRFRRMDLHGAAIALKKQHEKEALEKADFTERENDLLQKIAAVKKHLVSAIENAETYAAGAKIDRAAGQFRWLLHELETLHENKFTSIASKTRHIESMENRIDKILNGGE